MRRWGISLVCTLVLSLGAMAEPVSKPQLIQELYFEGCDNYQVGLSLQKHGRTDEAMQRFLRARTCFVKVREADPTFHPIQARNMLGKLDAQLRPLLLANGISVEVYLKQPKLPGATGVPAKPSIVGTPQVPDLPKPADRKLTKDGYEELLAQQRAMFDRRNLENLRKEEEMREKLRAAIAARPKSADPTEYAKEVAARKTLEQTLIDVRAQLTRLEQENATLKTQPAVKGSSAASLQQLAQQRLLIEQLQKENRKLRELLTNPDRQP